MVVSVEGKLKEHFRENELSDVNAKAILHSGGLYAACIFAIWSLTGNPVSIHHGRLVELRNVPSHQFAFQSESIPATSAQVKLLIRKCMQEQPAPLIAVSSIELTFDVTDTTVDYIQLFDCCRIVHWLVVLWCDGVRFTHQSGQAALFQFRFACPDLRTPPGGTGPCRAPFSDAGMRHQCRATGRFSTSSSSARVRSRIFGVSWSSNSSKS
jgi:hypothetical protein